MSPIKEGEFVTLFGNEYRIVGLLKDGMLIVAQEPEEGMTIFPNPVLYADAKLVELAVA
jgi:hypothetical protein